MMIRAYATMKLNLNCILCSVDETKCNFFRDNEIS